LTAAPAPAVPEQRHTHQQNPPIAIAAQGNPRARGRVGQQSAAQRPRREREQAADRQQAQESLISPPRQRSRSRNSVRRQNNREQTSGWMAQSRRTQDYRRHANHMHIDDAPADRTPLTAEERQMLGALMYRMLN